ncbi:caspase-1-like [Arctopsyche grandis]|uniref:caspase-1-like n=1 Tax=Arctopsyche grandis TaxID=121162 RepID=UPI00406DA010
MDSTRDNSYRKNISKPPLVQCAINFDPEAIYYDLTRQGLAIIFNHNFYLNKSFPDRPGAKCDAERLQRCFTKLNLDTKLYVDLSAYNIKNVMQKVAELSPNKISCLVIVVMTHGKIGHLAAHDKMYHPSVLWEGLAEKLIGIPKLYFIQACRGSAYDVGMEVTDSLKDEELLKLPNMMDTLIMYSTIAGYVSFRDPDGSWFIKTLCKELDEKSECYDLSQILTFVNKRIALDFESIALDPVTNEPVACKTMPEYQSRLTKLLKFNVIPMMNNEN